MIKFTNAYDLEKKKKTNFWADFTVWKLMLTNIQERYLIKKILYETMSAM